MRIALPLFAVALLPLTLGGAAAPHAPCEPYVPQDEAETMVGAGLGWAHAINPPAGRLTERALENATGAPEDALAKWPEAVVLPVTRISNLTQAAADFGVDATNATRDASVATIEAAGDAAAKTRQGALDCAGAAA